MGLLEKALQFRDAQDEKKRASGFLARSILYRKTMEAPGLLAEAERARGEEETAPLALQPDGLLAKASGYVVAAEKREGLLEKAERFGLRGVPRGVRIGKVGLLQRAMLLIQEAQRLEEARRLEAGAEVFEEEVLAREEPGRVIEEEPEEVPGEVAVESTGELIERYLAEKNSLKILNIITGVVGTEGYRSLFIEALKTLAHLGRGKRVILFTESRGRYSAEFFVQDSAGRGRTVTDGAHQEQQGVKRRGRRRKEGSAPKVSFRQSSKFIRALAGRGFELIEERSIRDIMVEKQIAALKEYEPWMIIPVARGDYMPGFALIGNQPAKPRILKDNLLLFAGLLSLYLCTYVLERNFREKIDTLVNEREKLSSLLELYTYPKVFGIDYGRMLEEIGGRFDVESAVLATGWDEKGRTTVQAGIGISEEGLKRYRVSKTDRVMRSIIQGADPAIPEDAEKRLGRFLSVDRERFNTFVVVPIVFQGQALGTMFVHRMKGVTKKLTAKTRHTLTHIAQSLVPFLLYKKMIELEPLRVFESILQRETDRAKRDRSTLHIVAFTVRNFSKYIQSKGFKRYRQLIDRLQNLIRRKVGESGVVHLVSLNRVVLLLTERDAVRVGALVKEVKSAVSSLLGKEKGKIPVTFTPQRTVYPLESRTVHDIMKLIG